MQRVGSADELAANPVGNYWLGETMLVWCADERTCGTITWGQPTQAHVQELTRALDLARHPALASGFIVFTDASAIEVVDWQPFTMLATYVRERLAEWATVITKQAVIVPSGPAATMLAGMVPLLGMTYPMKFFEDRTEAIAWLERPNVAEAITEANELAASARSLTPTVQRLRGWLEGALHDATLDTAAAALSSSARSLQRELQAASTSFTAELQAARVRVAVRKLTETDEKIDAIARDVGCVSASQLSALFKKHVGETPARVRERLRITK